MVQSSRQLTSTASSSRASTSLSIYIPSPTPFLSQQQELLQEPSPSTVNEIVHQDQASVIERDREPREEEEELEIDDEVLNDNLNSDFVEINSSRIDELEGLLGGSVDREYLSNTRTSRSTSRTRRVVGDGEFELDSDGEDRISTPVTLNGNFELVRDGSTSFSTSDEDGSERDEDSRGLFRRNLNGLGLDNTSAVFDSLKNHQKSWTSTELVGEGREVGQTSATLNHPYHSFTQIPSDISLPYHSMDDSNSIPIPSPSIIIPTTEITSSPPLLPPVDNTSTLVSESTSSFVDTEELGNSNSQASSPRGARTFFSNLLNRNPNNSLSSSLPTSGRSSPITRSISPLPIPFNNQERRHSRSGSLPNSPELSNEFLESSSSRNNPPRARPTSTILTPPSPLQSSPLARSSSLGGIFSNPMARSSSQPSTPSYGSLNTHNRLPLPKFSERLGEDASTSYSQSAIVIPTLEDIGLAKFGLTPSLSASVPLCGAILDNYILIGTTNGLDFLPIPLPGSLPLQNFGKRRKDTRKPISLIKRTRFKQLTVLSERSNILLAIAGRNDHIRVYALDTLRAMIEKKMGELDIRDGGYHIIPDPNLLDRNIPPSTSSFNDPKGKRRADSPLPNTSPILAGAFNPYSAISQLPAHHSAFTHSSTPAPIPSRTSSLSRSAPIQTSANKTLPSRPVYTRSARSSSRSTVTAVPTSPTLIVDRLSELDLGIPTRRERDCYINRGGNREVIISRVNSDAVSSFLIQTENDVGNQSELDSTRPSSDDWNGMVETSSSSPLLPRAQTCQELTRSYANMDLASILREGPAESSTADTSALVDEGILPKLRPDSPDSDSSVHSINSNRLLASQTLTRSLSTSERQVPREATTRISTARDDFLDFLNAGPPIPLPYLNTTEEELYRSRTMNKREASGSSSRIATALSSVPALFRYSTISPYSIPPLSYSNYSHSPSTPSFNTEGPVSSGMERESSTSTSAFSTPLDRLEPRDPSSLRLRQASRPSFLDLADLIRETGPSTADISQPSTPDNFADAPIFNNNSPNKRASKRWTINGLNSLLNRPLGEAHSNRNSTLTISRSNSPEPASNSNSDYQYVNSFSAPEMNRHISLPLPPIPVCQPLASTPLPPHDFKQRTEYTGGLDDDFQPSLPASSQIPQESTAPSVSNSSLEYVKLARTKGARMFRAVETKKRTYLAVLCGDEGERVELFTGSKNISLSLNRTFVLPESPRTIEFQIQQDDLVDIYLVYAASIFGLEPTTVRVREVGVGRGERRIRRDRERRMQDVSSESTVEPGGEIAAAESLSPILNRHPADDLRPTTPEPDSNSTVEGMDLRSPSPIPPTFEDGSTPSPSVTPVGDPFETEISNDNRTTLVQDESNETPPPVPPRIPKVSLPYTTFQQLPFIPPVPSSILSSAWVIPPLYSDVVTSSSSTSSSSSFSKSTSSNPEITLTSSTHLISSFASPPPAFDSHSFDLLSPISLLGGTAQQMDTPPGLFFVSKSKHVSGIVDANGRSVIRKPLVWNKFTEPDVADEGFQRIEVLVSSSISNPTTTFVAIGKGEVKAIGVGNSEETFKEAVLISSVKGDREFREIQFLGTHHTSSQLFYSDLINGKWIVNCLIAK